jgi:glycosyltransferase involved in cell wall biosynthesis
LRWWDEMQRGDLIHFFGLATNHYVQLARRRRQPLVMTMLFTETCNRSDARLAGQGLFIRLALALPVARGIKEQLAWQVFGRCTLNVVGLEAERYVLQRVYGVAAEQIAVVPLGLSEAFLRSGAASRKQTHLICTGTITSRKNCVELAEMARVAQTPIQFVGQPYHLSDPYWQRFEKLIDGFWVKHHPHVSSEKEMIALLQDARGFVLMSDYENWCLSAHEAAACGLPVLVQDQKWSRERFGNQVQYFPTVGNSAANIRVLKRFYDEAPSLSPPKILIPTWLDAARELKAAYERVLSTSR